MALPDEMPLKGQSVRLHPQPDSLRGVRGSVPEASAIVQLKYLRHAPILDFGGFGSLNFFIILTDFIDFLEKFTFVGVSHEIPMLINSS